MFEITVYKITGTVVGVQSEIECFTYQITILLIGLNAVLNISFLTKPQDVRNR
jgi:uncharacterized membrane protein YuzA (DUF378 family)